jgi:hypothetical protein
MAVWANGPEVSDWINVIFASNGSQWNQMVHMNKATAQFAKYSFERKPTNRTRCSVMLNAGTARERIALVL